MNADTDYPIFMPEWPKSWACQKWTFHSLASLLKDKAFSCRVWKKSSTRVFETQCEHLMVNLHSFCNWLDRKPEANNPLYSYDRDSYACYIDYKHMKDMFESISKVLDAVRWSDFGVKGFDGYHSTIWIGSEGAYTPCHQDSYGFNLVTQIQGRKMWILFPPNDASNLYPSRIPYEESSVFSSVDVQKPDLNEHPNFQHCHPIIVVLKPGQSLYVPHLWWHYVESLEPSISINVWIPLDQDKHQRVSEAITRCLATSLIKGLEQDYSCDVTGQLLNPTEDLFSSSLNYSFLNHALQEAFLPNFHKDTKSGECERKDFEREGERRETNLKIIPKNQEEDKEKIKQLRSSVNHLKEFQKFLSQCDFIPSRPLHFSSLKRKSQIRDLVTSKKERKNCKERSEQLNEQSSEKYSSDENEDLIQPYDLSYEDATRDDTLHHVTNQPFSSSSSDSTHSQLKIFGLNSIPFQEYLPVLQNIHMDHGGQRLLNCTYIDTHHRPQLPSDEPSHQHQQASHISPKGIEHFKIESDSFHSKSLSLRSPCQNQEIVPSSYDDISLTVPELAMPFLSSVLHPSVIKPIVGLLQENYLKAVHKKKTKTKSNPNC